jgi:ribosomal protein L11 methyltransferase
LDQDTGSWKMSLPCTQAEAELIGALDPIDDLPVLLVREVEGTKPPAWAIEAYLEREPAADDIAAFRRLVPSAAGKQPDVEWLAPADWLTLSQAGLEPVSAGRFFVYTEAHADAVPEGAIAFRIEAGLAFGTGQHETTTGCLMMLDRIRREGGRFTDIADIGTGTGLLAFAALRLWSHARVVASDIDPIAIDVSRENAESNAVSLGTRAGTVELVTAPGMAHRRLRQRAPYDLVIANILAGPLIDLAPVLSAALEPGGTLILAGLLDHQAEAVAAAYRRQGMRLADTIVQGDWPTLRLIKRRRLPTRPGQTARPGSPAPGAPAEQW